MASSRPNPYPPGSDNWHLYNLRADSWGHQESFATVEDGIFVKSIIYSDEMFELRKEDLIRGLAIELDIPTELLTVEVIDELDVEQEPWSGLIEVDPIPPWKENNED